MGIPFRKIVRNGNPLTLLRNRDSIPLVGMHLAGYSAGSGAIGFASYQTATQGFDIGLAAFYVIGGALIGATYFANSVCNGYRQQESDFRMPH